MSAIRRCLKGGVLAAATFALALSERPARAAGTALDVQSARGTGMAAAMTAAVDDSSGVFYNAAGIARGRGIDAQVGMTAVAPSFKFTDTAGQKTSVPFYIVPPVHAYVAGGITEDLALGMGVFTPYGLKVKWPNGWEGRTISTRSSLATYYLNPTVAYRVGPLRIGVGLDIVRGTVELSRDVRFGSADGSVALGAGAWGVGANVGAQLDLLERFLTLGVQYRSAVRLGFEGNAHFADVPAAFAGTLHDQRVTTALVQPDTLAMGVAVRPLQPLVVDFDIVWFGWSKLNNVNLDFPDDASGSLASSTPKNWSNTANMHLGGELAIDREWRVRAGALVDPSPSPKDTLTPDIPDATRVNLAIGGGYTHRSGVYIDLGYQFIVFFSRHSTAPALPGDYGGFVNLLGVTAGFSTPLDSYR